jgi:hypothetical protein
MASLNTAQTENSRLKKWFEHLLLPGRRRGLNNTGVLLVSHRYKFIYTKTGKTAGTSVESYFERFCMPEGEWIFRHAREEYISESGIIGYRGDNALRPAECLWWNHMPASLIRERIGEEIWADYFKFCVVRSPYEVAVSAFYFFRSVKNQRWDDARGEVADLEKDRAEFEAWLHSAELPVQTDKYLMDGKFCLDAVARHESLHADLEKICARLGIPWEPRLLPALKAEFRPGNTRIEALYAERSRKIVEAANAFEIDYFGYSFPAGHGESPSS